MCRSVAWIVLFLIKFVHNSDIDVCKTKVCLARCCGDNEFVRTTYTEISIENTCEEIDSNVTISSHFSNLTVCSNADLYQKTNKTLGDVFHLMSKDHYNISLDDTFVSMPKDMNYYLTEDGRLHEETPNTYDRWMVFDSDQFCVAMTLDPFEDVPTNILQPRFFIVSPANQDTEESGYNCTGMLVSCVFLALVFIIYSILPDLRNLSGMVLMAYVASLFGAYLSLAVLFILVKNYQHTEEVCCWFTYTIYFFFLAAFCWMNVMSFDIWWTFRGYAKARAIHRRGELCKFFVYCLYAWGVPLAMTITFIVLNVSDLSHTPWIITPRVPKQGCFIEGTHKFLYLYVPMLILIFCNWLLFLLTAYNVWRLARGNAVLNASSTSSTRTARHRLIVYLKLSMIMGVSWVLEVVSYLCPGTPIWHVTDLYNLLIGVAIFWIFVCKPKIWRMLKKINKTCWWSKDGITLAGRRYQSSTQSNTTESYAEQEVPLNVCPHPNGPRSRSIYGRRES